MRLHLLTLGLAAFVCSCGGGISNNGDNGGGSSSGVALASPSSIDGLWSAFSDGLGSTLTMTLSSKDTVVSGIGTYSTGAIRTGSITVTGTYRPPSAALTIIYDHGESVTFAATLMSGSQMKGKLTYKTGTVIDIEFVRP